MSAQNSSLYVHISREVVKETIFADDQDYQVFLSFLKDYFSDTNSESAKKSFTVRGRTYKGHPHRPQNFFNQIELIAYKLEPNRFDLLIKQITLGSLKKFTRALSTRYAIYFNKKHHRKGTLFREPYQTQQIKGLSSLLDLTRELHRNFSHKKDTPAYYYSSYPEYLGQRETSWIKSEEVLSIEGASDYKAFVQGGQSENGNSNFFDPPPPKSRPRIPEIFVATLFFALFTSYGIINIHTSASSITPLPTRVPSTNPEVLGEEEIVFVIIKISDNSESVNIRQGSSISTAKIGKAKQDDRFEFVAVDAVTGWYQIKLTDGSIGFVSARYAEMSKEDLP